jgi:hypothetical protein
MRRGQGPDPVPQWNAVTLATAIAAGKDSIAQQRILDLVHLQPAIRHRYVRSHRGAMPRQDRQKLRQLVIGMTDRESCGFSGMPPVMATPELLRPPCSEPFNDGVGLTQIAAFSRAIAFAGSSITG